MSLELNVVFQDWLLIIITYDVQEVCGGDDWIQPDPGGLQGAVKAEDQAADGAGRPEANRNFS